MNKSTLFVTAWSIARTAAIKFGGSVKSYFSESLKMAHAMTVKKMVVTAKKTSHPSYTALTITNAAEYRKVFNDWHTSEKENGSIELPQVRRTHLAFINSVVSFINSERKPDPKNGGRYVELLSVARIKNLSHGRSWICSHNNCVDLGLDSDCNGFLNLCYVYPN